MTSTVTRANDLLRLATNPGASEGEATNAARALARLMASHGLRPVASAEPTMVMLGLDPIDLGTEILEAAPMRCEGYEMGVITTVSSFAVSFAQAVREREPSSRRSQIHRAFARLTSKLEKGLKPSALRRRELTLGEELDALFAREPEQPGADAIAKKLKARASDVRREISRMVKDGQVKALGSTRNRRYRRVPVDARAAE